MQAYQVIKMLHILSAVLITGTGFGTAFYLFVTNRCLKSGFIGSHVYKLLTQKFHVKHCRGYGIKHWIHLKAGASTAMFMQLAKLANLHLPLPFPRGGNFAVQPVHVGDVAEGLVSLAMREGKLPSIINMTGSQVCTLAEYLQSLAKNGYGKNLTILPVRMPFAKLGAKLGIGCLRMFSDRANLNMIGVESLTLLEDRRWVGRRVWRV